MRNGGMARMRVANNSRLLRVGMREPQREREAFHTSGNGHEARGKIFNHCTRGPICARHKSFSLGYLCAPKRSGESKHRHILEAKTTVTRELCSEDYA